LERHHAQHRRQQIERLGNLDAVIGELFERLVREYWQLVGETALVNIPKLMMAEAGNFPQLARFYYEEVSRAGTG